MHDDASTAGPAASIVVPAHDEAARGFRTLPVLEEAASTLGYRVVVVCNGCTDETASLARAASGVSVLELAVASKASALNAGDAAAGEAFPRVYLDADVTISLDALRALVEACARPGVLAAGPAPEFDLAGAPWLVRRYHEALGALPTISDLRGHHLEGRGAYAVSAEGRRRFGAFPELRADDAYFDRMFDAEEKRTVLGAHVVLSVPQSARELLRAQARSAAGTRELTAWLRANRPDRLVVSELQSDPTGSLARRAAHHLARWRGRVAPTRATAGRLLAYAIVESAARASATAHAISGRDVAWR